MPKKQSTEPIPPFPESINREAFGHWFAGFTDGEGCFLLTATRTERWIRMVCGFHLRLRDDDGDVIRLIRSHFQIGYLIWSKKDTRPGQPNKQSQWLFSTGTARDCLCIAEHFEKFPLRAKKKSDFPIWKRGSALAAEVVARIPVPRSQRGISRDKDEAPAPVFKIQGCDRAIPFPPKE